MAKLIAAFLLAISVAAHAASFDCAKAGTPQEKAICASPGLSKADDEMAAAYRRALEAAPAEVRDLVRTDQREWLTMLPRYCPDPAPAGRDQTLEECLLAQYQPRIKQLNELVQQKGGVTFVWRAITRTVPEKTDEGAMEVMPGYATLTASWPVAVSNSPEWQAWNDAVLDAAKQVLVRDDSSSAKRPSPVDWAAGEFADNTVDVALVTVSPPLVSAHVQGTWWRGAHPSENYIELNWLLPQERELRAEDMFLADSDWQASLYTRCDQALHKQLDTEPGDNYQSYGDPGRVAKTLHALIADPKNWQLDHDGLSIVFPEYSVAPRAAHPEPVTIPWADLKPFLNPGFQRPAQ